MKNIKYEEIEEETRNIKDKTEELIEILRKNNIKISTAESITGGLIASTLVGVAGASDVFEEGYITYSNSAKHKVLGVSDNTLDRYTAVSKEVCSEMIVNLKNKTNSDSAIVTTGYAGPGDNAGLVYIGVNFNDIYIVRKYLFNGKRNEVREKTTLVAIQILKEIIMHSKC